MDDLRTAWCEKRGVYAIHKETKNSLIYYSFYGGEGFYKIEHNFATNEEKRTPLRYSVQDFRKAHGDNYNYFTG